MIILAVFILAAIVYALLKYYFNNVVIIELSNDNSKRLLLWSKAQRLAINGKVLYLRLKDRELQYKTESSSWKSIRLYEPVSDDGLEFRLVEDNANSNVKRLIQIIILFIVVMVPIYTVFKMGYYNEIVLSNITAEKERINNGTNINNQNNNKIDNEILEVSVKNFEIIPVMAASEAGEPVDIMAVNKEFEFTDSNNNTYSADKLVNHPICTYYKCKDGTICLFVGQYDENYKWTGKCRICAYKNSKLFFATENVYDNNKLVSYRRISKSSDRGQWLITDKEINNNDSKYGHTWSYRYEDIGSKVIDLEKKVMSKNFNPTKSELYSIDELEDKLKTKLVSHYYGAYDQDDNWKDSSGDAYCVQYNDDRSLKEVFKGVFLNNRYMSGHFFEKMDSDQYKHYVGVLHKDNNGIIVEYKDPNLINETLSTDQFKIYIHGEPYEKEVLDLL